VTNWPADDRIAWMDRIPRLAFEMALTEELERRSLAGEANALSQQWREAEEVAEIADNMFLPAAITDWLARGARRADS
jgi:predicted nuclease with TOPRIM domain